MLSQYILIPLIAAGIAQVSKFFVKSNRTSFTWHAIFAYSGMPSSHAAITISLAMTIGLHDGFGSALFGLAFVFALITIRDAAGLRRQLGRQGKVLNNLTKELDEDNLLDDAYPIMTEKIGHTPTQLLVGSMIGLVVAIIGQLIW